VNRSKGQDSIYACMIFYIPLLRQIDIDIRKIQQYINFFDFNLRKKIYAYWISDLLRSLKNNTMADINQYLRTIGCILLILYFTGIRPAHAQSPEVPISLGIGGAYSYIPTFENSRILGYTLGIYGEYPIVPKLNLLSGLIYNRKGGENGGSFAQGHVKFEYRYDQFSIPIMLRYDVL